MVSRDFGYLITELERRLDKVEQIMAEMKDSNSNENLEWDNAILMQKWRISRRTAANYRKQGLEYFKRGGRLFYSLESRERFMNFRKQISKQLNVSSI